VGENKCLESFLLTHSLLIKPMILVNKMSTETFIKKIKKIKKLRLFRHCIKNWLKMCRSLKGLNFLIVLIVLMGVLQFLVSKMDFSPLTKSNSW
jgi:hypothetical protein